MTKYFFLAFLAILLFSGSACNHISDRHTATIDSLLAVVEGDLRAVEALDSNELVRMHAAYIGYNDFFAAQPTDTSNPNFYTGPFMDMSLCRKRMGKTIAQMGIWKSDLRVLKKQLTDLRHAYERSLLDSTEFIKHLYDEGNATAIVHSEVTKLGGTTATCIRNFARLSTQLDSAKLALSAPKP